MRRRTRQQIAPEISEAELYFLSDGLLGTENKNVSEVFMFRGDDTSISKRNGIATRKSSSRNGSIGTLGLVRRSGGTSTHPK